MNNILGELIERIDEGIESTLLSASISMDMIDKIIITGGASLTYSLQKYFNEKFSPKKILNYSAFDAVAKGLAIKANNIFA